jgi:hypothetical protein
VYPGGNAFYVHEEISDKLMELGVDPDLQVLENIFWPFVDPMIRHALRGFKNRERSKRTVPRMTNQEQEFIRTQVHQIDKRRLNYLRLGHLDQSQLTRLPEKFYRSLAYKARDELEQWFMTQERDLSPREYSSYVYSFLNLRRHFYEIFAGSMPQGLDIDKLDQAFLEDICELNRDSSFWCDEEQTHFLHPYLIRYVIMYFDYSFAPSSFLQDKINDYIFKRQYQSYKQSRQGKKGTTNKEIKRIFGANEDELLAMSRAELIRRYRKLAHTLHPDKGGDHEAFIELTEVYKILLRRKRS